MGIIWEMIKAIADVKDIKNKRKMDDLSRECDMIGLDKEEKWEVMRGNQEPYDFEWDGEEETDYYKDANK